MASRERAAAYYAENRDAIRAKQKLYYAANAEKVRARKALYDASPAAVARRAAYKLQNRVAASAARRKRVHGTDGAPMYAAQQGKCAICEAELQELPPQQRHLDHCHATGKVRGWLCGHCNKGLGHFRDNPVLLAAAIDYLKKGTEDE